MEQEATLIYRTSNPITLTLVNDRCGSYRKRCTLVFIG